MRLAAIDLEAALDILVPPLTEEGCEFPEQTSSSLSLSLSCDMGPCVVCACVDVLAGGVYTDALNIADVVAAP